MYMHTCMCIIIHVFGSCVCVFRSVCVYMCEKFLECVLVCAGLSAQMCTMKQWSQCHGYVSLILRPILASHMETLISGIIL